MYLYTFTDCHDTEMVPEWKLDWHPSDTARNHSQTDIESNLDKVINAIQKLTANL